MSTRIMTPAENRRYTDAEQNTLFVFNCPSCGVRFGISDSYDNRRREDHRDFYCPNGHTMSYSGPSEVEKERDRLKRQLEWTRSSARSWEDQAETAEARRRAEKGAKTKLQKRIAAGVCPCCHRSFQNLQRHIAGQHPDYAKDDHGGNHGTD